MSATSIVAAKREALAMLAESFGALRGASIVLVERDDTGAVTARFEHDAGAKGAAWRSIATTPETREERRNGCPRCSGLGFHGYLHLNGGQCFACGAGPRLNNG